MAGHDIIVVGASAGGVEALASLAGDLPADLPAAVFVVLHVPPYGLSVLPSILAQRGPLPVHHPADGEAIVAGRIYVAPPDHHLLIEGDRVRLSHGPGENGHRPAIDTLFRSAARSAGPRVVGVVLSGSLDDGTAGLKTIKMCGGVAVVQDPEEALFPSMPRSAVDHVAVDYVLPVSAIGPRLAALARASALEGVGPPVPDERKTQMRTECGIAEDNGNVGEAPPSGYACPDCRGALRETREGESVHVLHRAGHADPSGSPGITQVQGLEDALWFALRALEESAALAGRLGERSRQRGHAPAAERFEEQAQDTLERAAIVRHALVHRRADAARDTTETGGDD